MLTLALSFWNIITTRLPTGANHVKSFTYQTCWKLIVIFNPDMAHTRISRSNVLKWCCLAFVIVISELCMSEAQSVTWKTYALIIAHYTAHIYRLILFVYVLLLLLLRCCYVMQHVQHEHLHLHLIAFHAVTPYSMGYLIVASMHL